MTTEIATGWERMEIEDLLFSGFVVVISVGAFKER